MLAAYGAVLPLLLALFALPPEQIVAALKSPITYLTLVTAAIYAVLRFLDKRRHIQGKIEEDPSKIRGLSGF